MNPADPPRLFGSPPGAARFKVRPEDFQVEEILGFEPSGSGEHCFVWVEKTDVNSNDVSGQFAERLGIRKRLISHCGLKDKHAVTRQWFSIHLPGQESPEAKTLEGEGVRVLKITRNQRKLRRGSHDGNRFWIRLRECDFSAGAASDRWRQIESRGVPNYYGPQRFGRGGGNVEFARRLFAGEVGVRDRALLGILVSAARSFLFNACVAERLGRGMWDTVVGGDVFGFADNRSLVLHDKIRGDEAERVAAGTLEITAPLWGEGALQSRGEAFELEHEVISRYPDLARGLERFGLRQERRVIRLRPEESELHWEDDETLSVRFELPKGAYATTVLREWAETDESSPGR